MEVFRVTQAKYADRLFASGWAGRWNREGEKVIYTAASRSLACLENLVHRRGRGALTDLRVMVIYLPDLLPHRRVELVDLSEDWNRTSDMSNCQRIGSSWYTEHQSPVLWVPSAVVPMERNLVVNAEHPGSEAIRLIHVEAFYFDPRLSD